MGDEIQLKVKDSTTQRPVPIQQILETNSPIYRFMKVLFPNRTIATVHDSCVEVWKGDTFLGMYSEVLVKLTGESQG